MTFEAFPALNKQHETLYDSLSNQFFTGDAKLVHEKVENGSNAEREADRKAK